MKPPRFNAKERAQELGITVSEVRRARIVMQAQVYARKRAVEASWGIKPKKNKRRA